MSGCLLDNKELAHVVGGVPRNVKWLSYTPATGHIIINSIFFLHPLNLSQSDWAHSARAVISVLLTDTSAQ